MSANGTTNGASSTNPFPHVKALTFDVFGTCVDWRTSITAALVQAAERKTSSPTFMSAPFGTRWRVVALKPADWAAFAQQWRAAYGEFTRSFVAGTTPWKDIDTHHLESLGGLLAGAPWHLPDLYTDAELRELSRAWHFLDGWPDAKEGLARLGTRYVTASLSNGNRALLEDLDRHAGLGFKKLLSAEDFKAYKPDPATYGGACEALALKPEEVAMVAAHLGDLAAARECGLRTIYVDRPGEEEWRPDEDRYKEAREWVDVWVSKNQGGFEELARKLGA